MSVLACDRSGCPSIMCDRLILDGSAYLCDSCNDELLSFRKTWPERMTGADVKAKIERFLTTQPGTYSQPLDRDGIDDHFSALTGNHR